MFAVVGHVEWVEFLLVEHLPTQGEIVHAREFFEVAAGGGAVAAVQLRKLHGRALFFTALGDDELGHKAYDQLTGLGLEVHATWRPVPQRRGVTFLDDQGERTITVIGERLSPHGEDPLPWDRLQECRGIYVTAADRPALEAARQATRVVATSRVMPLLRTAGVSIDVILGSLNDKSEVYDPHAVPFARTRVLTQSGEGGRYYENGREGSWRASPLPGPPKDAYGCGDSFAAGLTYGLGQGMGMDEALELAARCGATCLTGRGPYEKQLSLI